MVLVIGKTCSGKTTIVNELMKHGFHKIITTTSRAMRDGEIQGKDYHFVSDTDFKQKIQDGYFAEWKSYNTVQGVWYYGTSLETLVNAYDNSIIIIAPSGCREVLEKLKQKPIVLYIYANNATIKKRLKTRGDLKEEADRRIEADDLDFKEAEKLADRIFYNNEGKKLNNIVDEIINYLNNRKEVMCNESKTKLVSRF